MKTFAILTALALVGCTTVEHPDGSTTTSFDAKAATSFLETGFGAYDRYQRQSRIIGYDAQGNPIYRQSTP